jgi:hypothetical protein
LQGATSKRDSMWHSPVFTSISPNRIPVNIVKRSDVKSFDMQVDSPYHQVWSPYHLLRFHKRRVLYTSRSGKTTKIILRV